MCNPRVFSLQNERTLIVIPLSENIVSKVENYSSGEYATFINLAAKPRLLLAIKRDPSSSGSTDMMFITISIRRSISTDLWDTHSISR